jgi:hypothetical protein
VRLDRKNLYHADEWHQVLVPAQGKLKQHRRAARLALTFQRVEKQGRPLGSQVIALFHNFLTSLYSNTVFSSCLEFLK